ncbi:MAG: hypothetical protein ACR2OR_08945 [Hyphomicrobiales bacterium]
MHFELCSFLLFGVTSVHSLCQVNTVEADRQKDYRTAYRHIQYKVHYVPQSMTFTPAGASVFVIIDNEGLSAVYPPTEFGLSEFTFEFLPTFEYLPNFECLPDIYLRARIQAWLATAVPDFVI